LGAGRQAQDGVLVALVHQVGVDFASFPVGKKDVVQQDDDSACFNAR
jgi:hypothetical protein